MKALPLVPLVLLGSATLLSAQLVSLNLLDSDVHAGELFSVEVNVTKTTEPPSSELLSFAFDVGSLLNLNLEGAVVSAPFLDDSAATPFDVAGSAFPGITASPVTLAVLSFRAPAPGVASFSISGPIGPFGGLKYTDFDPLGNPPFVDADYPIEAGLQIDVLQRIIPEPGTAIPLGLFLLTGCLLGRRRRG